MNFSTKILIQYVRRCRRNILVGMLAALAFNMLSTFLLTCLQRLAGAGLGDGAGMHLWFAGFLLYVFLYALFDQVYISKLNQVETESIYTIRKDICSHLLRIRYRYFTKKHFGELNTNMIQDLEMLGELVFKQLPRSLSELVYFSMAFSILFCTDARLACALLGFIALFTFYTMALKRRVQKYAAAYAESRERLNTALDDYVNRIGTLRLYGKEKEYTEEIDRLNRRMNQNWLKLNIFGPLIQSSIEFATLACYLLIFGIGGKFVLAGTMAGGALFLFLSHMPQIWDKYSAILDIYTSLLQGQVYAQRVFGGWELEREDAVEKNMEQGKGEADAVHVCDVGFWYEPEHPILKRFSHTFHSPGLYCVSGPSGCGKSTLFDLLLGLYAPQQGEIRIGDLAPERIRNLSAVIGLVHQDPYMIDGSIEENIRFGDQTVTKERVEEFLRDNGFSKVLPVELAQRIPRGSGILTTGMRRMVSLARTMVRDPDIVLLDEVTAGLDSHTERLLLRYIRQISERKICVMISHKPGDEAWAKEVIRMQAQSDGN